MTVEKNFNYPRISVCFLVFASFWSTWYWFVERIFDNSDEPIGILSACALLALVFIKKKKSESSPYSAINIGAAAFFYLAYILSFTLVSKLASATLATLTLCFTINALIVPLSLAETTLALLSLPVVASINFYLGFPLRVIVAKLASILLAFAGIMAQPHGALLTYNEKLVYVDAPCSGVKLLWFALFITAFLSSYLSASTKRTLIYLSIAFLLSIFANGLRVTSLFYLECDLIHVPYFSGDTLHQLSGLIVEGILLLALAYLIVKTQGVKKVAIQNGRAYPKGWLLTLSCLALATAILPVLPLKSPESDEIISGKKEPVVFPDSINGDVLIEVSMPQRHQKFLKNFPGELKIFKSANKLYIVKRIEKPTRKVHPAADCFRGSGYSIDWQPIVVDKEGSRWSHFIANKGDERVSVKEHILDNNKNLWTDPSSWYWSAVLGETKPPWWGITVEEGGLR